MKTLSIVIPVYFNEKSLPLLFSELMQIESDLIHKNINLELIFVDDGSGDNSFQELLKIKQQRNSVKLIRLTRNFGAIQAVKIGFGFVTGDCFMALAADLQDPPQLILDMADEWLRGSKYIVCVRTSRHDPLNTKLFAAIYYKLLRFFVIKDFPAGGYDLALMDKAFLPHIQNCAKNINIALFAYWLGFKPTMIPYERQRRSHGKSRWTMTKKIKYFLDSLLGFSIVPIRTISIIGLFVSLFSFSYGVIVIISAALGGIKISGFTTIAALISFLLGLIIIMLGIIGEYIWRIFDEAMKKPEAVIDEIF